MLSTRVFIPCLLAALVVPSVALGQAKAGSSPKPASEAAKTVAQDPEAGETSTGTTGPEAGDTAAPSAEAAAEVQLSAPQATDEESVASGSEGAEEPSEELSTLYPNKAYIDAVTERSKGQSLGYAVGRHGDGFILALRYDLPVNESKSFFLRFNHHTNFGPFRGAFDPVLALGVDTMMRSKLIFGLFRLYGGGGFWVGLRPTPRCANPVDQRDADRAVATTIAGAYNRGADGGITSYSELDDPAVRDRIKSDVQAQIAELDKKCKDQKDDFTITGGGYSGIEFFSGPMRAFFIEVGGGGGAQKNGKWYDSGLIIRAGNQFYF